MLVQILGSSFFSSYLLLPYLHAGLLYSHQSIQIATFKSSRFGYITKPRVILVFVVESSIPFQLSVLTRVGECFNRMTAVYSYILQLKSRLLISSLVVSLSDYQFFFDVYENLE